MLLVIVTLGDAAPLIFAAGIIKGSTIARGIYGLLGKVSHDESVLITSVSSSDHSYLQFTFDFMTLTQNFNLSYFEQSLILVNL